VTPDKKTIYILNESELLEAFVLILEKVLKKELLIESDGITIKASTASETFIDNDASCCFSEEFFDIGSAHSVVLTKEDIKKLIPIGQFNNGFIICLKLSDGYSELFAIDQHAADERIRFEEIASYYSISHQKLVQPIKIDLKPDEEEFVQKNIVMISATGFSVRICDDGIFLDELPGFHGSTSSTDGSF
jgi:DNA mismatch repair ATPase MutL